MTERHSSPDGERAARPLPPGAPRWVKVFAMVGGLLVLLFGLLHLAGLRPHHGGLRDHHVRLGDAVGTSRP